MRTKWAGSILATTISPLIETEGKDLAMTEQEDRSPLRISADRIRESVLWRLWHEDSPEELLGEELEALTAKDGFTVEDVEALPDAVAARLDGLSHRAALTSDQEQAIAKRFALNLPAVEGLSRDLAQLLNPRLTPNKIDLPRATAIRRARNAMNATIVDLEEAADRMTRGLQRLDSLDTTEAGNHDGAKRFDRWRQDYDRVLHDIEALHRQLRFLAETPDVALDLRPADRRHVSDYRRRLVLFSLFAFWAAAGRKLTVTTDPIRSRRTGRLVDFINAIVCCMTDPPGELSGDTILFELRAFKSESEQR